MQAEYQDNPFQLLCDLDKKSRDRSGGLPAFQGDENGWTGVLFNMGENQLLAPMSEVREIVPLETVTMVPATAGWLLGIMNLRGNLLPVIDLEGFLYGENLGSRATRSRLLIVDHADSPVGLLVSSVIGMKHFRKDDVASELPKLDKKVSAFIAKSYKRQKMNHAVFNVQDLLMDERFRSITDK